MTDQPASPRVPSVGPSAPDDEAGPELRPLVDEPDDDDEDPFIDQLRRALRAAGMAHDEQIGLPARLLLRARILNEATSRDSAAPGASRTTCERPRQGTDRDVQLRRRAARFRRVSAARQVERRSLGCSRGAASDARGGENA
jgi:hypothetical protein